MDDRTFLRMMAKALQEEDTDLIALRTTIPSAGDMVSYHRGNIDQFTEYLAGFMPVEKPNQHFPYRAGGTTYSIAFKDKLGDFRRWAIIAFQLYGGRDKNAFTLGHEEGHALEFFERHDVVEDEARKLYGVDLDLSEVRGETFANVAGIVACGKNGTSLDEMRKNLPTWETSCDDEVLEALEFFSSV